MVWVAATLSAAVSGNCQLPIQCVGPTSMPVLREPVRSGKRANGFTPAATGFTSTLLALHRSALPTTRAVFSIDYNLVVVRQTRFGIYPTIFRRVRYHGQTSPYHIAHTAVVDKYSMYYCPGQFQHEPMETECPQAI